MKTTLVGFISGHYFFAKEITSKTKKGCEDIAKEYLKKNTVPGTSSVGTLWANKSTTKIKVRVPLSFKNTTRKGRILY